ncbi:Hypothetical predicted protein [Cloeon dipterum]|uniref:Bee-milk protein n=2 Tax=Cloeon dipterum TaxID=197152 RepID=A0A8S1DZL5_9INSE|nr:Hypothetical predicted protein [Cloeon dipterum]
MRSLFTRAKITFRQRTPLGPRGRVERGSNAMSPFLAAIFLHGLCLASAINFTYVYEWDKFDFIWPSGADTTSIQQMKQNFKPEHVFIEYTAVFGERMFLNLFMNSGTPASLVWLPTSGSSSAPPKLAPFPSWRFHQKNKCSSIQAAKGIETDADGRLWVVDEGSDNCPGKLWIFNLLKNDETDRCHQFLDAVVSHRANKSLRDIVIDKTSNDCLAYITDYNSQHIVVYSRKSDQSWLVKTIGGMNWHSLALSPNREARQLYLGKLNSKELYSVSVSELKNKGGSAAVKFIGRWSEIAYRMIIDSANVFYTAFYDQNYTSKWNISEPFREKRFHEVGTLKTYRPFTFALGSHDTLWMTERNQSGNKNNRYALFKTTVGARPYFSSTSTALTTPEARGTTSVATYSAWIPASKTTMRMRLPTEDPTQKIFTTTSTQHYSSALPLTTMSTTNVNEETSSEVAKSSPKIGTPQPTLKSNETCGDCAYLEGDYRKSQSLNTVLIWLLVCYLVLSGTVIVWLALRTRRMQIILRKILVENHTEMSVFPEDTIYDDVGPGISNTTPPSGARPENPDESLYAEVHSVNCDYASARPPFSAFYEEPLLENANAGEPSEAEYDEVGYAEQENIYDDVGPGPSSVHSRRKPTESVQYLELF